MIITKSMNSNSENHVLGTLVTTPVEVTCQIFVDMTTVHLDKAETADGWNISTIYQPPNSPDLIFLI